MIISSNPDVTMLVVTGQYLERKLLPQNWWRTSAFTGHVLHLLTISIVTPDLMPSTSDISFGRVLGDMIRLVVREIAQREGIENPNALSQAAGLPYETCRRLWQEKATMISLNTIERLCDALRVRPAQLFDYEHEPGKAKRPRNAERKLSNRSRA